MIFMTVMLIVRDGHRGDIQTDHGLTDRHSHGNMHGDGDNGCNDHGWGDRTGHCDGHMTGDGEDFSR